MQKLHILDIDRKIFEYVYKYKGWSDLSNKYLTEHEAKDKTNWLSTTIPIQLNNLIAFLGIYRKIIIDYLMKKAITDYININDYTLFLKEFNTRHTPLITLENTVLINAFGSNNPTSDYDVTFAGPGIHIIVQTILNTFNNDIGNKHNTTITKFFDSNFYLVPDIIINNYNKSIFTDNNINLLEINKEKYHFVPIPDESIIKHEFIYLLLKIRSSFHETTPKINDKYNNLIQEAKKMDDLLYTNSSSKIINFNNSSNPKEDFFIQIMKMSKLSIEAYYCLSTVLAVVYSIQAKRNIDKKMSLSNWLIASIENLIDFVRHHSQHFNIHNTKNKAINNQIENLAIKLSKYIYRIYYCINKYYEQQNLKLPDNFESNYNLVKFIYNGRGSGNIDKENINKFMNVFSLHKNIQTQKKNVFVHLFNIIKTTTIYEKKIDEILIHLFNNETQQKERKKTMKNKLH